MIIRLHVILVSHIASRRLIELGVRLAAGGRAARTREPWYEAPGDSVQIEFGPVTPARFKEPWSPLQLFDDAVAHVRELATLYALGCESAAAVGLPSAYGQLQSVAVSAQVSMKRMFLFAFDQRVSRDAVPAS